MVAFARARTKSLFSKLFPQAISKTYMRTNETNEKKDNLIQKEKNSNYFLEAIKTGGIWLS